MRKKHLLAVRAGTWNLGTGGGRRCSTGRPLAGVSATAAAGQDDLAAIGRLRPLGFRRPAGQPSKPCTAASAAAARGGGIAERRLGLANGPCAAACGRGGAAALADRRRRLPDQPPADVPQGGSSDRPDGPSASDNWSRYTAGSPAAASNAPQADPSVLTAPSATSAGAADG